MTNPCSRINLCGDCSLSLLARSVSLHYPKSIAQAVSLAETTELAVKASRRRANHKPQIGRAPNDQNRGGEANGEDVAEEDFAVAVP